MIDLSDDEGRVFTQLPDQITEGILYEYEVDLSKLPVSSLISVQLNGIAKASANPVGFNVYLGATAPGNTAGGFGAAYVGTASLVEVGVSVQGAPFVNPGGLTLVQITGVAYTSVGDSAYLRGVSVIIG